jgi:flagellar hook-associated protein 1 FlgK
MADLLNIGASGLLAFQRSLDTVSHNIANVNTAGYSVQNAELMARQADQSGSGWVGNGVDVTTIRRSYDTFVASQVRTSSSSLNYFSTYSTQATRVNNLLGDSSTGITATLQSFANAVQAVSDSPTSIPARQTLLSQAQTLVTRLNNFDSSLKSLDSQAGSQLSAEASTITGLAANIAQLNQQIVSAQGKSGQPPNDLLDQRDALVDQLSTHVNVSTVAQDDGSINVFVGSGQSLVMGVNASKLVTGQDSFDATRKTLVLQSTTGSTDVTSALTGGSLGGMLDFRTQVLDPARDTLGKISVGIASVVNAQHKEGMDLNGQLGGDVFAVGGADVRANSKNTGTGGAAVTISDASAITGANYLLNKTATGWSLQRADTGAAVTMTGAGTTASPFVADGLSFVVSGAANTGDRFLVQPTRSAVSGMQVLITDPSKVAVAAPIIAAPSTTNSGSATVSAGEVLDATNPQLLTTTTISFVSATQYTTDGGATLHTYTAGSNIDANGWRVQINGAPTTGDSFVVKSNAGGTGDNRNSLALVDAIKQPALNGKTASLSDAAGQFVSGIGVLTNQAQSSASAQQVVYNDSLSAQQSVSGVNLDEEASKLLQYQQAYQAAAQIIKTAQTLFNTLISAAGGG